LLRVDLDYPQGVRRIGNRYLYDDVDLKAGEIYRYKMRSFTKEGTHSRDSNKPQHRVIAPPPPPVLEVLSSPNGVVLAFAVLPPKEGTLVGVNVYRSKKGEPAPLSPLNAAPVTGTTYTDQALLVGASYDYTVTSVATLNGESVESLHSNRAEGTMQIRD
jgi:hypothetical protein